MRAVAVNLSKSANRSIVAREIGGLHEEVRISWSKCKRDEEVREWLSRRVAEAESNIEAKLK